ncbi:hypothetical protein [Streptomyces sp. NPDC058272]|uniref:hypothetical protein n=1 Tax=Streptomyces sp. NPDC058272 TaxID=3346415 RepID=UPI0036F103B9
MVSRERAANEHGFADLKNWRILTKVRMNARHATELLRALLVLTNSEITAGKRSRVTITSDDHDRRPTADQPDHTRPNPGRPIPPAKSG